MKPATKDKLAVIGLGYVGLPLAVEIAKQYEVIGFDINTDRINQLNSGFDASLEVSKAKLYEAKQIKRTTTDINDLVDSNIYINTVPTPIDTFKLPYLKLLIQVRNIVGKVISKGDIVIFDPVVNADEIRQEFEMKVETENTKNAYVEFLAVPHERIKNEISAGLKAIKNSLVLILRKASRILTKYFVRS